MPKDLDAYEVLALGEQFAKTEAVEDQESRKAFRPRRRPGTLAEAQVALANLRKTMTVDQDVAPTQEEFADRFNEAVATPTQEPFRAKNARPLDAERVDDSKLDKVLERISTESERTAAALDRLTAIMSGPGAPITAITSSVEMHGRPVQHVAESLSNEPAYRTLNATLLKNGDMSFRLRTFSTAIEKTLGYDSEAFRESGSSSRSPVISITGTADKQIAAAMDFAKQRWAGDAVHISVSDKNRDRIIHHAVKAGLNIDTSRSPELAALVQKEQDWQKTVGAAFDRSDVPTLQRVSQQAISK